MSNHQNEEFLENAGYNFRDALDLDTAEGYEQAQAIVNDVADISKDSAEKMQAELDEAKGLYDHAMRQSDNDERIGDQMREDADLG